MRASSSSASPRAFFSERNLTILSAVLSAVCLLLAVQILLSRRPPDEPRHVPTVPPPTSVVWTRVLAGGAVLALYDHDNPLPPEGRGREGLALATGRPADDMKLIELLLVAGAAEGEGLEVGLEPTVRLAGGTMPQPLSLTPIGGHGAESAGLPSGTRLVLQQLGVAGADGTVPAGRAKRLLFAVGLGIDLDAVESVEAILAGNPIALERQQVAPGELEDIIQRARRDSLR